MGLRYKNNKESQSQETTWASYSDLFMVLSFVFLLLYVVTTLKDTTSKVQKNVNIKDLQQENKELKRQILTYNNLKEQYLKKEATKSEQEEYKKLMSHLDMLQENTKRENEEINKKIVENTKRKNMLNQYQKMIKNIINANILAKRKIVQNKKIVSEQDDVIEAKNTILSKKREAIEAKTKMVASLEQDIQEKNENIKEIENQKKEINKKLNLEVFKIKRLKAQGKITQSKMLEDIEILKKENHKNLENMNLEHEQIKKSLVSANSKLAKENQELEQATAQNQSTINEQMKAISSLNDAISKQKGILAKSKSDFEKSKAAMKNQYEQAVSDYDKKLAQTKGEKDKFKGDLEKLKKIASAKEALISNLGRDLASAGIPVQINKKTQEIEISFGDEYFDTGKFALKKGMKKAVRKFMPIYAKTLFENKKLLEKINSVEIIGFSSPTYKGKVIDPSKLTAKNRKAINYNLDLSYYRARSIFQYAFDKNELNFEKQDSLLPYIKVTGRSFLQEGAKGRDLASAISTKEYCKKYDCKKSQKVIIKFNMD